MARDGGKNYRSCAIAAAALVAILTASIPTLAQSAPQKASLRLDWLPSGQQAPFYMAAARGYYSAEGIDLDIFDGKGSGPTVQVIGAGTDTFGFASLDVGALAASKGAPVVAVMGILQKNSSAVLSLKGSGIHGPKDLEGKRIGMVPGGSAARIFSAFVKANGVDYDKINRIEISFSTLYTTLLQGNADGVIAFTFDAVKIAKQKPMEPPLVFADYGVNTLASGVIVNKKTLADQPDLVRRFLAATAKGIADTVQDPAGAAKAIEAARPNAESDLMEPEVKMIPDYLHTHNSEGHPVGWMAKADWEQTLQILTTYYELTNAALPETYYTNDYLPAK